MGVRLLFVVPWFGLIVCSATAETPRMRVEMDLNHLERLTRANARVAAKQASVDSDPLKPQFHIMPAAGGCGDPNGPLYANGKYHMFFQHSPEFEWGKPAEEWEEGKQGFNHIGWGHASSTDLVYWEHEPIALMPERDSYDPGYCASGCAVIDDDGTPTIVYAAAEPQTICLARSHDRGLRWWRKAENNPVLREPQVENYVKGGFRDPYIWREGSTWQMIVCGAIRGVGGTVLYFRSENLVDWTFVKPMCTGLGEHCTAWECPNFLRFGDKAALVVSPLFEVGPRSDVVYTVAPYSGNGEFAPNEWRRLDIGGPSAFYASNCMKAPDGRWLMWGMNLGGGAPDHHWTINLSLPRVITLRADGTLGQEPPTELQALRRAHWSETGKVLAGEYRLAQKSTAFELLAEIEVGDARTVGLDVRGSDDFSTKTRICYDTDEGKLHADACVGAFKLLKDEETLRLHVFVDRSVVEAFVNGRECATVRPFCDIGNSAIRLFSEGGTARIRSVDLWEMGSIWQRPATGS